MKSYGPFNPKFPFFLHGGDYNPDQWLHVPGTVDEDFRMFPLAGINSLSVAIFSWAQLEPEEGRFEFGWLDDIFERAAKQGMGLVLATPSGGKPAWLAQKYPEIRRMNIVAGDGGKPPVREQQMLRHNHCMTSPVYREKVAAIDARLSERYGRHPALALWHISNEYGAECRCPLCMEKFRGWLKDKYGSLDALNQAWWTGFWSHRFFDWSQIENIDTTIDGLAVDWCRFTTENVASFLHDEVAAVRRFSDAPVTTNLMAFFTPLDYWRIAKEIDVVSWDAYPQYHERPGQTESLAAAVSLQHSLNRSLKGGRPFLLMESSPGPTNWYHHSRMLRPGMHRMKSLQAVAYGSDSVQYFQIRKGRGGAEKFHGAVIDHVGHEHTRMFGEVAQVGRDLKALRPVLGGAMPARVGIIVDWESTWHMKVARGPVSTFNCYSPEAGVPEHYQPFWKRGITVDVLNGDSALDGYDLVIAPHLFMLREGFGDRVEAFVANGGTFVATWLTGYVNETGLCFGNGFPGPLRKTLGIWNEEIDNLYDDEQNIVEPVEGNPLGLSRNYTCSKICERIHAEGAEVVARYGRDFYAGEPAVTVNRVGKGQAWYIAAHTDYAFLDAFYGSLADRLALPRALEATPPEGVAATVRENENGKFTFVVNYAGASRDVELGAAPRVNLLDGRTYAGLCTLPPFGALVLQTK